jgi:hypothetical protein
MTNEELTTRVQALEERVARLLTQRTNTVLSTEELITVLEVLEAMSDEELDRAARSAALFGGLAKPEV